MLPAGLVYAAESPYNPNLSNYFQTFYFAVTTLTTVGFGDITPVTPAGLNPPHKNLGLFSQNGGGGGSIGPSCSQTLCCLGRFGTKAFLQYA